MESLQQLALLVIGELFVDVDSVQLFFFAVLRVNLSLHLFLLRFFF